MEEMVAMDMLICLLDSPLSSSPLPFVVYAFQVRETASLSVSVFLKYLCQFLLVVFRQIGIDIMLSLWEKVKLYCIPHSPKDIHEGEF